MSPSEPILRVVALSTSYDGAPVLRSIGFDLVAGEVAAVLGPNGSGKTTLLRAIAGLEPLTTGEVELAGTVVTARPTHRRGIGFLFQDPAMLPGRTVEENVAYGLDLAGWEREAADARVSELLDRLDLARLRRRDASTLSGGERQRVALARTLAPRPRLVLLDEPLASVDPERRTHLREQFREALRREGVSGLYVTHDPEEALAIADRLFLLRRGTLVQSGPTEAVFRAPVDAEAARFLGYQLLPDPPGIVAVLPRELVPTDAPETGWTGVVEGGRPAVGEAVRWIRTSSGVRIEWRPRSDEAAAWTPGRAIGLRPTHAVRYPAPPPGG